MEARNPYLILGIPFGASREQANVAFARKTKGLRRSGGRAGAADRDKLTDLTWALNQIDEATATGLDVYRIPADPEAFAAPGAGVLSPPPETLPPRGGDRDAALMRLQIAAAHEFLRYLVLLHAGAVEQPAP